MPIGRLVGDDATVEQRDDAIRVLRHIVVVRDQHDGLVEVARERADHLHHIDFGARIEIAGRLVGEHDLRPCDERARDADALLLAAGHLRGVMRQALAEPDPLEDAAGHRLALGLGHTAEHERHGHVLDGIEVRHQIVGLEHEAEMALPERGQFPLVQIGDDHAADAHAAARGLFHAGELVEQGGLAGAGFAVDAADLPARDAQVDAFERHHGLVRDRILLAQVPHFDHRARAGCRRGAARTALGAQIPRARRRRGRSRDGAVLFGCCLH